MSQLLVNIKNPLKINSTVQGQLMNIYIPHGVMFATYLEKNGRLLTVFLGLPLEMAQIQTIVRKVSFWNIREDMHDSHYC